MTKNLAKAITLSVCAVLLVATTIAGTVAYLTSQKTVQNSFTFGNVAITMDELKVDAYGNELTDENEGRTETGLENTYKLIPGHLYNKDTKIHVSSDSESCWLFVQLDPEFIGITNAAARLSANDWEALGGVSGVYYYNGANGGKVSASATVTVLDAFTVNTDQTHDSLSAGFTTASIIAYAVQVDGFDTAELAWENTFGRVSEG